MQVEESLSSIALYALLPVLPTGSDHIDHASSLVSGHMRIHHPGKEAFRGDNIAYVHHLHCCHVPFLLHASPLVFRLHSLSPSTHKTFAILGVDRDNWGWTSQAPAVWACSAPHNPVAAWKHPVHSRSAIVMRSVQVGMSFCVRMAMRDTFHGPRSHG